MDTDTKSNEDLLISSISDQNTIATPPLEKDTRDLRHIEIDVIKEELNSDSIRIAGANIEEAIKTATICHEEVITPWFSPRFQQTSFDQTQKSLKEYTIRAVREGFQDDPLIVANELVFDCTDALGIQMKNWKDRHHEVHSRIQKGERPDVTEKVKALVKTARECGWKGPLCYASFAYENVSWEKIDDPNLIVGANLYWERNLETNTPKPIEDYIRKIDALVQSANGRKVVITEFGSVAHEAGLGTGGGGFLLRGKTDYTAQAFAIKQYLEAINHFPDIGTFAYAFREPQQYRSEASYALAILKGKEVEITQAAKEIAQFYKARKSPKGVVKLLV